MSHRQPREPVTDDFSQLPRDQASEGFTDRVLASLENRVQESPKPMARLAWAGTATLVLAMLTGLGLVYQRQRTADLAYQHQVEELRSRYEQLLDEVVSIRHEAAAPDTRLYLGGDESLDLMLDLNQLSVYSQNGRQETREVRPASWEQ